MIYCTESLFLNSGAVTEVNDVTRLSIILNQIRWLLWKTVKCFVQCIPEHFYEEKGIIGSHKKGRAAILYCTCKIVGLQCSGYDGTCTWLHKSKFILSVSLQVQCFHVLYFDVEKISFLNHAIAHVLLTQVSPKWVQGNTSV